MRGGETDGVHAGLVGPWHAAWVGGEEEVAGFDLFGFAGEHEGCFKVGI
jgi:hypothetical protein